MIELECIIGETRVTESGTIVLLRAKSRGHTLIAKCQVNDDHYNSSNEFRMAITAALIERLEFQASRLDPVEGSPQHDQIYQNWDMFVDLPTIIEKQNGLREGQWKKEGF
jgi:hypothetical protein